MSPGFFSITNLTMTNFQSDQTNFQTDRINFQIDQIYFQIDLLIYFQVDEWKKKLTFNSDWVSKMILKLISKIGHSDDRRAEERAKEFLIEEQWFLREEKLVNSSHSCERKINRVIVNSNPVFLSRTRDDLVTRGSRPEYELTRFVTYISRSAICPKRWRGRQLVAKIDFPVGNSDRERNRCLSSYFVFFFPFFHPLSFCLFFSISFSISPFLYPLFSISFSLSPFIYLFFSIPFSLSPFPHSLFLHLFFLYLLLSFAISPHSLYLILRCYLKIKNATQIVATIEEKKREAKIISNCSNTGFAINNKCFNTL